jgi:hypothetical protein
MTSQQQKDSLGEWLQIMKDSADLARRFVAAVAPEVKPDVEEPAEKSRDDSQWEIRTDSAILADVHEALVRLKPPTRPQGDYYQGWLDAMLEIRSIVGSAPEGLIRDCVVDPGAADGYR